MICLMKCKTKFSKINKMFFFFKLKPDCSLSRKYVVWIYVYIFRYLEFIIFVITLKEARGDTCPWCPLKFATEFIKHSHNVYQIANMISWFKISIVQLNWYFYISFYQKSYYKSLSSKISIYEFHFSEITLVRLLMNDLWQVFFRFQEF